jgi:hypothetical protein
MAKILRRRISGKHNSKHGCQRFSATINRFSNVTSTILQKNNGTTAMIINPEGVGIRRYPLNSRGSLRNSTIFGNRVQANTWGT